MDELADYENWIECWQCGGCGKVGSCFEDTCVCYGDPDDPDTCCAPRKCDVCYGKGGWKHEDVPGTATLAAASEER